MEHPDSDKSEYPPEGRFAWDLVLDEITFAEMREVGECLDAGLCDQAEAVIAGVEARLFKDA